jgi:DNA ligase (NAD+)
MPSRDSSKTHVDKLTETQARAEHARLEAEIKKHDEAYYQKDAPTVSDAEYDALRRRYESIEGAFPNLRTLDHSGNRTEVAYARELVLARTMPGM